MAGQRYENDVVITSQNLELTKQIPDIPITSQDFTDVYWLGWINYDNLPTPFHISKHTIENGVCTFEDITEKRNYPIGYFCSYLTSPIYMAISKTGFITNNGEKWDRNSTSSSGGYVRLPNKLDINTTGWNSTNIIFMVYGTASNGTYIDNIMGAFGCNDPTLSGSFQITMSRRQGSFFNQTTLTLNYSDFSNGAFEFSRDGIDYKIAITNFEVIYFRDINTDNTASSYAAPKPSSLIMDDQGQQHLISAMTCPFIQRTNGYNWGSGETYNGFYLTNNGIPTGGSLYNNNNGVIRYYGGLTGSFNLSDIHFPTYEVYFPQNANFFIVSVGRSDFACVLRIYKTDDLRKLFGLNPRFSNRERHRYENSTDYLYAHVSKNNEFLCKLTDGSPESVQTKLKTWQIIEHTTAESDFDPATIPPYGASPIVASLWSIKETNNNKIVANCFPYNKNDAGAGTFFAMIRSKILSWDIVRNENNDIVINNLSLLFEDVVRKSADVKNEEDIPETPTIAVFNFSDINSSDFIGEENSNTIVGKAEINNFTEDEKKIIELKDDYLKQGFYKGQIASYFHNYAANKKIKIEVRWYDVPQNPDESGWQIFIKDKNGDIIFESAIYLLYETTNIELSLPFFDENGNPLEYIIEEQIYRLENNWNVEISQRKLKNEITKSIIMNKYIGN